MTCYLVRPPVWLAKRGKAWVNISPFHPFLFVYSDYGSVCVQRKKFCIKYLTLALCPETAGYALALSTTRKSLYLEQITKSLRGQRIMQVFCCHFPWAATQVVVTPYLSGQKSLFLGLLPSSVSTSHWGSSFILLSSLEAPFQVKRL